MNLPWTVSLSSICEWLHRGNIFPVVVIAGWSARMRLFGALLPDSMLVEDLRCPSHPRRTRTTSNPHSAGAKESKPSSGRSL